MSPLPTAADGTEGEASSQERRLRYRVLLEEYRTLLLIAFVLLFAVGGWASYGAYADPGEERDERLESEWTATGEFTHSAVVTESNAVYERGTRLEDEPLYYESVSPVVDAEFAGGYEAASGENVTVELTVDLVYRAVDPDDGTVYWSERERLESVSASDVDPGEPVTAAASVNVTDVRNSIDEIESDLGASPGETEIRLDLERSIAGTIEGDEQSVTDGYEVAIETEESAYRLADDGSYDEPYEEHATETVAASPGSLRAVGGPLLAALGLIGVAGVGIAMLRLPPPTAAEREWLAYRDDRAEFDEVITTVGLPASALEGPRADVESLAALARLGIDLETAVLFDPDRRRYVVRDGDLRYVFDPPRRPRADDVLAPVGGERAGGEAPTDEPIGSTADALEPVDSSGDPDAAPRDPAAAAPLESTGTAREPTDGEAPTESTGTDPDTAAESTPSDAETASGSGSSADAAPDANRPSEPSPEPGSTAEIGDDDLLSLAGLDPADISEPELFDPDGGRERSTPPSPSSPIADEEGLEREGERPERRSNDGS